MVSSLLFICVLYARGQACSARRTAARPPASARAAARSHAAARAALTRFAADALTGAGRRSSASASGVGAAPAPPALALGARKSTGRWLVAGGRPARRACSSSASSSAL